MSLEAVEEALKKSENYRNDLTELKVLAYQIELAEDEVKTLTEIGKSHGGHTELGQIELERQLAIIEVLKRQKAVISDRVKLVESL